MLKRRKKINCGGGEAQRLVITFIFYIAQLYAKPHFAASNSGGDISFSY